MALAFVFISCGAQGALRCFPHAMPFLVVFSVGLQLVCQHLAAQLTGWQLSNPTGRSVHVCVGLCETGRDRAEERLGWGPVGGVLLLRFTCYLTNFLSHWMLGTEEVLQAEQCVPPPTGDDAQLTLVVCGCLKENPEGYHIVFAV